MSVYVDALGEEIALETARAFAEERLGRPLTDGERALDLVGLDVDLAEGKERLARAIEAERRRALEVYLRGGPVILRVTVEMEAAMIALVEAGRRHAREEMERLGVEPPFRAYAEADDRFSRFLRELIAALTGIRVRLTEEARGARFGTEPITEELIERLDERIPGARDFASRVTSGLLIGGLGEVYETNADLFPCFLYSAVMDAATCSVCRTFDGRRYETWVAGEVDLPGGGPNPLCLGDGRCRCRLVPCAPGETAEAVISPEPEVPPEIAALRRDVEDFPRLSEEEFADLVSHNFESPLFAQSGYASRELRDREERMRTIGRGIDEEATRRADPERLAREQVESEERINRSREKLLAEMNRHYELRQEVERRVERELFGEGGANTVPKYDQVFAAVERDPDVLASDKRLERVRRRHERFVREEQRAYDPQQVHAETLREVLDEIRGLGGSFERRRDRVSSPVRKHQGYRKVDRRDLREMADDQARYLPFDWVEASNERGGFHVAERGRGHYSPNLPMAAVSGHTDAERRSTMLHELGHRMEHIIPEIKIWEWVFKHRRLQESADRGGPGFSRQRLVDLEPDRDYGDDEWAEPDDFADPYTGRDYGDETNTTYEILSMGLEALFHGGPGDADHRDFVLGLLATIRYPGIRSILG